MKLSSRGEREKEKMRAGAKKLKKKKKLHFFQKKLTFPTLLPYLCKVGFDRRVNTELG